MSVLFATFAKSVIAGLKGNEFDLVFGRILTKVN